MKKIIIFCVCIVVLIAVLIIGNLKVTTVATGTLVNNGESEVTIKITRTNFDKLFNRISKDITVEGDNILYRFDRNGNEVYELEGVCFLNIGSNREGDPILGTLCFDDELQNIVIHTTDESIYSADEDFIAMVDWCNPRSGS